ncbi:MAG: universal stress protein, partial [Peptostreptococcaceae bacterium]|nr:universal stress protein [Peptostreptococcaceae bacterium]
MKKILIPVDSSKYAKRAVEQGIKMAKAFGSQVVLLYVANIIINYSRYEINL